MNYPQQAPRRLREGDYRILDPGDGGEIGFGIQWGKCGLTSGASAETRTLAAPDKDGYELTLYMSVDGGGDITVDVGSELDVTGNTAIVFDTVRDLVRLISIQLATGTFAWQIIDNTNVTLATTTTTTTTTTAAP